MTDDRRCTATNRSGGRCAAIARPGRDLCQWHDPELAEERDAWNRKGGQGHSNAARIKKALPAGVASVSETLLQAIADVVAGKLHPSRGNAVASLARAYLAAHEAGEIEIRLAAMERQLAEREAA